MCRPAAWAKFVKRLGPTGHWAKDDGKPAIAFVGEDSRGLDNTEGVVMVADCDCVGFTCPRVKAMSYAAERYDSATVIVQPTIKAPRKSVRMKR